MQAKQQTTSRHELPSRECYDNDARCELTGKWSYDEVQAAFDEYTAAEQAFDAALTAVEAALHPYLYFQRADGSESQHWSVTTEKILPDVMCAAYAAFNYANEHYPDELYIGSVGLPAKQRYPITNWRKSAATFRRLAVKLGKALPATKRNGTSRETRQVARERVVQQSLRREGTARYNELVEVFTCASTSTPGARYTITHDTVTGAVVCNCPAGEHQRGCLHVEGVTRYLRNRADAINRAADEAVRAHEAMEQRAKDTALLRRNNQPFSLWK